MIKKDSKTILKFGRIKINESQIFYKRKFVFAFVNLRPFLPGHVLLSPTRVEKYYSNLTETELIELWISAKNIAENLKKFYHTDSVQINIQDGENSGQTVEHCHLHIIPVPNNYQPNNIDGDGEIKNRTIEEMAKEAEEYRNNFVFN